MIIALFIIGFTAIGLAFGLIAAAHAPVGYEDANGFHFGPEHATAQEEIARGSSQPTFA